jgi:DNA repair protein RadA/Sms
MCAESLKSSLLRRERHVPCGGPHGATDHHPRLFRMRPLHPRWQGQCPGCEAWNTLVEEAVAPRPPPAVAGRALGRRRRDGRPRRCAVDVSRGRRPAPRHRHRRVRPRARRRHRPGLARAARGSPGHRQVDAHEHGARQPRRARVRRTLYVSGRSRRRRSACAPSGSRAPRSRAGHRRDRPRHGPRDARGRAARRSCVIDSVQTLHAAS